MQMGGIIMGTYTFVNDGIDLYIPNSSNNASTFIDRSLHEPKFRQLNKILIDNKIINNNIIDSGAWIGDNALPWSKMIDGFVYAIDPSEDNCNFISTIAQHNSIHNIKIIRGALTDSPKVISTDWDWYHCSFINGLGGKNSIEATTIDILHDTGVITNIGYIHLDVEGMEFLVLKGSERTISKYRPVITFEQHINTDPYIKISEYLKLFDYQTFLINEVLPGCLPDCRNFLSLPNHIDTNNTIDKIYKLLGNDFLSYII